MEQVKLSVAKFTPISLFASRSKKVDLLFIACSAFFQKILSLLSQFLFEKGNEP